MPENPQSPLRQSGEASKSAWFRNYAIVSAAAFLLAGGYVGWVFYSRWSAERDAAQKAAAEKRQQDQRAYEMMGGDRFAILAFNATPASIRAGDNATLCYSLSNAKSVKLDPPDAAVSPGVFHCVQVTPAKTTIYKLTAADGNGHTAEARTEIEVH